MLEAAYRSSIVLSLARNISGAGSRLLLLSPQLWNESLTGCSLKRFRLSVKTYFGHSRLKSIVSMPGTVRITPGIFTGSRALILLCAAPAKIRSFFLSYFAFSSCKGAARGIKQVSSVNFARALGVVIISAVLANTAFLYFLKPPREGRGLFLRGISLFIGHSLIFLSGKWRKAVDNSVVFRALKIFIAKF